MSSMNPSTSTLSRNLGTGNKDLLIGSTYNLSQLDTKIENMISETVNVLFCNLTPSNTMTQNNNANVSTTPIADATLMACELNVNDSNSKNDDIVIRKRAEIVEIPITQINQPASQQGVINLSFQPQWYILTSDQRLTLLELQLSESQPTSAQPIQRRNVRKRKLSKPMKCMKKTDIKKKIKKRVRRN